MSRIDVLTVATKLWYLFDFYWHSLVIRTFSEKPNVVTSWQFQAPSSIHCFTWAFCKILHVRFIDMWLSFYQFFPPLMWIPYACMQWMDGGTTLELPRHSSGVCSAFPLGSPQFCTLMFCFVFFCYGLCFSWFTSRTLVCTVLFPWVLNFCTPNFLLCIIFSFSFVICILSLTNLLFFRFPYSWLITFVVL